MIRVSAVIGVAVCVHAGTVQGVVVEHASGRPLTRAIVRLEPVPKAGGTAGRALTTRAGRSGQFVFSTVESGLYLLVASHEGSFPSAFGQRLPIGRGTPLEIATDSDIFAELRLRHKGAITGRVLDENGVGEASIPVVAYRAKLPLRSAGSAMSDDRGVYRIHGLEPGKYWVRSGAHTFDDGSGWLPTYGPGGREVRDARTHLVTVDADTTDADVNPEPGRLFHAGGQIVCDTGGRVTVTLSSETGRRSMQAACPKSEYRFDGLAPAAYEVYATLTDGSASGFSEFYLDHDTDAAGVQVREVPWVDIQVRRPGSGGASDAAVTLIGRRQDLSETEPEHPIVGSGVKLAPGHWEMRARVPAGSYVESITNDLSARRRSWKAERPSDWFDVFVEPRAGARISITVSDQAGQITGRVMTQSRPVPGVPVFLWPVADSARRSLGGSLEALADTDGRFRFDSLPPGDYRILASFDVNEFDDELAELSRAPVVHAAASQVGTIELPVWIAP